MSNNTMFLVHVPSGLAAPLLKENGSGWYNGAMDIGSMGTVVNALIDALEKDDFYHGGEVNGFALAFEDAEKARFGIGVKRYGEWRPDGLVYLTLDIDANVAEAKARGEQP